MVCRDMCVYLAQLAHQTGRFDDMFAHMVSVSKGPDELSAKERLLLYVAFKSAVGSRRDAWRNTQVVELREVVRGNTQNSQYAGEYCTQLKQELHTLCDTLLAIVDGNLIPTASNYESMVLFWSMKADCHRYIAEFAKDDAKAKAVERARVCYGVAQSVAKKYLEFAHPLRLVVALNYSVFLYELLQKPEEARNMARTALEDSHGQLDNMPEDSHKDSILIMRYLCDNLNLWSVEQEDEQKAPIVQ